VTSSSPKSNKNARLTSQNSTSSQDDNLSSIPRLNQNLNNHQQVEDQSDEHIINWNNLFNRKNQSEEKTFLFSQSNNKYSKTPDKQQEQTSLFNKNKSKEYYNLSSSSDKDSISEHIFNQFKEKEKQNLISEQDQSIDQNFNNKHINVKQVTNNEEQSYRKASDILLERLSSQKLDKTNQNQNKSQHQTSTSDHIQSMTNVDTWLSMLEKLEFEHKQRLEKQQKQYEDYMKNLEENMKRRFDEYLSTTNSQQESKSIDEHNTDDSLTTDSNSRRYRTNSNTNQYRPLATDQTTHHYYRNNSTNNLFKSDKQQQPIQTNLSRSQSREDISNLRNELSAKHAKHISDLKSYYEHEIDELKNQLNISRKSQPSSTTTRQSIETIERINNENIRLHDDIKRLRHSLKINEEENNSLQQQLEEIRNQMNNKDVEIKNFHKKLNELEQQLNEAHHNKQKQDEKFVNFDRQILFYRDENEKLTRELNLYKERLARLEELYRQLENQHNKYRQQTFTNDNNNNNNQRINPDYNYNSAMSLNIPTSREYGHFTLIKSRYSSSTMNTTNDNNTHSIPFTSDGSQNLSNQNNSPRSLNKMNDYINEKNCSSQFYVPPSRPLYSPIQVSSNRNRIDQMPVRVNILFK
ncbi:unnamed protein product, partial [Rotaria sp. Silwood1]